MKNLTSSQKLQKTDILTKNILTKTNLNERTGTEFETLSVLLKNALAVVNQTRKKF